MRLNRKYLWLFVVPLALLTGVIAAGIQLQFNAGVGWAYYDTPPAWFVGACAATFAALLLCAVAVPFNYAREKQQKILLIMWIVIFLLCISWWLPPRHDGYGLHFAALFDAEAVYQIDYPLLAVIDITIILVGAGVAVTLVGWSKQSSNDG